MHDWALIFAASRLLVRHEQVQAQLGRLNVLMIVIAVSIGGGKRHFPAPLGLIQLLSALNLGSWPLVSRWQQRRVNGLAGNFVFLRRTGT